MNLRTFYGVAVLLAAGAPLAAQTTISTSGTGNMQYGHRPADVWTVHGQTFTTPTDDTVLDSWSVYLGGFAASPTQQVQGFIMKWNDAITTATGSTLYSSDIKTLVMNAHAQFTFETGGLELNAGQMYVAFVRLHNPVVGSYTDMLWDGNNDQYTGGELVVAAGTGANETLTWATANGYSDANFRAVFSESTATPEPVTMTLLGTGLAGVAAAKRRRKLL